MQFIEKGTPGKHCWDWIEQIYRAAGADHQNVYRGSNYVNNLKRWDAGFDTNPKNPPMVNDLQPGDWFFVYNRNGIDDRDAHSVIFLSWENQAEHIAKVASCPHSGSPGRIHDVNLNNKPMVFAMKPVSNGKAAIG